MFLIEGAAVVAAGFFAGAANTIVGSGSLITYPTLAFVGVPPVTANIANTVGLVPGSIATTWGNRDKLGGTRALLIRLGAASVAGAICGALLLPNSHPRPSRWSCPCSSSARPSSSVCNR